MKAKEVIVNIAGRSSYATSIVNPYVPTGGVFYKIMNLLRSDYHLSQMKISFLDFNRTEFPVVATQLYAAAYKAWAKFTKPDLLKLFTYPNYEIISLCHKLQITPPFLMYPHISHAKIVHATICSEQGNKIDVHNFAHVTLRMTFETEEWGKRTQFNVFERRLDIKQKNEWKLALIEDVNS